MIVIAAILACRSTQPSHGPEVAAPAQSPPPSTSAADGLLDREAADMAVEDQERAAEALDASVPGQSDNREKVEDQDRAAGALNRPPPPRQPRDRPLVPPPPRGR